MQVLVYALQNELLLTKMYIGKVPFTASCSLFITLCFIIVGLHSLVVGVKIPTNIHQHQQMSKNMSFGQHGQTSVKEKLHTQ